MATLVGVSDERKLVASVARTAHGEFGDHVSATRSQPYYLDVTHPRRTRGCRESRLDAWARLRAGDHSIPAGRMSTANAPVIADEAAAGGVAR